MLEKIEFLTECHSTNAEMIKRIQRKVISVGQVLYTDYQSHGKGQRGNVWLSEPGKNLLFSIYLKPLLAASKVYLLNVLAGISVQKVLAQKTELILELKWPNDLFFGDKKLGGILVETFLQKDRLDGAVVGVGLNVNQKHFLLSEATSVFLETNREFDRLELLTDIQAELEYQFNSFTIQDEVKLLEGYYERMRWFGESHMFRSGAEEFEGIITGVDGYGRLQLLLDKQIKHFDIKEIVFLY